MVPLTPVLAKDIDQLVDCFYEKVRHDAEIGPIFNQAVADWPTHLRTLKDFWSTVLLTERRYQGDPLARHLPLQLQPAHFRRWLALFQETAREVMPPEHAAFAVAKSHRIAENFQLAIAYQQGKPKQDASG